MSDNEQMAGPGEPEAGDGLAPEVIGISGELTLRHIRGGKVIDEQTLPNIVVNSGLQHFARLLIQDPNDPNRTRGAFYIQIGTGAIGPHPTDPSATIVIPPQVTDTALYQYFSQSGTKINVPGDGGGDDEAPRRMRIQEERGKKGDPDYVPFTAIAQVAYTFDFGHVETVEISEAGLFTGPHNSDSCIMLSHRTFARMLMLQADFLEIVWDIGFSRM